MNTAEPDDETPKTALEQPTEQELAVWSHLHGDGPRRRGLEPLTATEQAEFAPFAAVLARARDAGFRARHVISDARDREDQDVSELKVFRERPDGPTEVIVFRSGQWAEAFRVPGGAPLFGPAELEEKPGRLLDLVLAGAWPEDQQAAAVQAWVEQLAQDGYATTGDRADVAEETVEEPPAVGWVQSPSDGLWHMVQPAEDGDIQGEGVVARCGHRIPSATHAEEQPGHPACLDCAVEFVGRGSGWSI